MERNTRIVDILYYLMLLCHFLPSVIYTQSASGDSTQYFSILISFTYLEKDNGSSLDFLWSAYFTHVALWIGLISLLKYGIHSIRQIVLLFIACITQLAIYLSIFYLYDPQSFIILPYNIIFLAILYCIFIINYLSSNFSEEDHISRSQSS